MKSARLNELSAQLVAMQAATSDSSSRQTQAQGAAADRLQEVINNPVLSGLRGDITRAEAHLQELSFAPGRQPSANRRSEGEPRIVASPARRETRRVTGSLGVTNTINRQREAEIRGALEAQRARVLKMRAAREEGAVLIRDLENAQRAYDAVLARLNQSSLESQTTQSNAYVLAQAVPPIAAFLAEGRAQRLAVDRIRAGARQSAR